jgi:LysM repeat protein
VYLRETNIKKPATITYDELLKEKTASNNSVKQTSNSSLLSSKTLEKSIQAKSVSQTAVVQNTISTNNNQSELIAENTTNKNVESNKNTENIISTTVIKSHEVKPGDTVFNISKRYGINLEDIIKWNNIENYAIKLGQVLNLTP